MTTKRASKFCMIQKKTSKTVWYKKNLQNLYDTKGVSKIRMIQNEPPKYVWYKNSRQNLYDTKRASKICMIQKEEIKPVCEVWNFIRFELSELDFSFRRQNWTQSNYLSGNQACLWGPKCCSIWALRARFGSFVLIHKLDYLKTIEFCINTQTQLFENHMILY